MLRSSLADTPRLRDSRFQSTDSQHAYPGTDHALTSRCTNPSSSSSTELELIGYRQASPSVAHWATVDTDPGGRNVESRQCTRC